MVEPSTQHEALATAIERIHARLAIGEGPSADVIRQEAVRAKLPASALEAMLRLDKRFVSTPAGWGTQAVADRWPDLVRALPHSLNDPVEATGLFRQVVVEMSTTTRSGFAKYYPDSLTLPDSLRQQVAALVQSCPEEAIPQLKGPIFDLVMSYVFDDAGCNRFFTPRPITTFVAAWARPLPGERIADPCHGSAGFSLAMAQWTQKHLAQAHVVVEDRSTLFDTSLQFTMDLGHGGGSSMRDISDKMLYGIDRDPLAAWSGKSNLDLHSFGTSNLHKADALDLANSPLTLGTFDIVAGNPSFGDKITDPSILEQFELGRDSKGHLLARQMSEALFLETFLRLAKPGGRVAILLPDGVLSNVGEQRIRDYLVRQAFIEAVIALPRRVFRNDAKSSVLLLRKKENPNQTQERPVFLASVEDIQVELGELHRHLSAGPIAA